MDEEENENVTTADTEETTDSDVTQENTSGSDTAQDTDIEETVTDSTDTKDDTEKITVKRVQYYVKRTRTKVLTDEEAQERRIAIWKHEQDPSSPLPDPIEETEIFTLKSQDEEVNCLLEFDEEEFEEAELPDTVETIKTVTTQEELYSYSIDETTGDVTETSDTYDTVIEYSYVMYEDEKDKPDARVSGICADCKYCILNKRPFHRYLCEKHTFTDKVTGRILNLPCRDFNDFGECELWEEKPEEETEDSAAVTDNSTVTDFGNEDGDGIEDGSDDNDTNTGADSAVDNNNTVITA